MANFMVTTVDNIHNPFTNFIEWYTFDSQQGYRTCEWISNFVFTSVKFDDEQINKDIEFGVSEFLKLNPFGMHYKVYEDEADKLIPLMYNTYMSLKDKSKTET